MNLRKSKMFDFRRTLPITEISKVPKKQKYAIFEIDPRKVKMPITVFNNRSTLLHFSSKIALDSAIRGHFLDVFLRFV